MPDDENPPENPDKLYLTALMKAWNELTALKEQERQIIIRKAQLSKTCSALFPLVFPEAGAQDVSSLSLPNAIRLMIGSSDRPLSARDVQTKLEDIGFDLKKFENPLANILTAMKRMVENEELVYIDGENKRVKAGPELKPAPDLLQTGWEAALAGMASGGAMPEGGFFTPPLPPPEKK